MSPEVPVIIFVIAIPMYFISKVSLKKLRIGSQDNRKYIAIIPTIILSPLIYIATILIWIFSISYYILKNKPKQSIPSLIKLGFAFMILKKSA